jgi:hypothetical protein
MDNVETDVLTFTALNSLSALNQGPTCLLGGGRGGCATCREK